ncbi:permease [Heliobacterium chlorum]|uniref:Permease n=1 Tax=Heliobacterium chlorum TaxID=2698 RepID=A0ABR7T3X0_HELCL|nr:permease [Heliobacterium chlorum]MBC9785464.1 permease [Heliobacterium chlorum]
MAVLVMRMRNLATGGGWLLVALAVLLLVAGWTLPYLSSSLGWQTTRILLLAIFLEALPFLLLGVLVSAVVEVFVSPEGLKRLLPAKPWAAVLVASMLGMVFPFCECGIIPVVRRLIHKGLPLYAGITFLLAAPVVNPVVLTSTAMAFRGHEELLYGRIIGVLLLSWLTGMALLFWRGKGIRQEGPAAACGCGHTHDHSHDHLCGPAMLAGSGGGRWRQKWIRVATHAVDEFFDLMPYFLAGALLASILQGVVPREWLMSVANQGVLSTLAMMLMAFILSVCSNADAFLASSLAHDFPPGAILAFLVLGPMLDIKNTWVLFRSMQSSLVIFLLLWLPLLVFAYGWAINGGWILHLH